MADTIRQQIVSAIETRMKTITVANGYSTAIGSKVYTWRLSHIPPSDIPHLLVFDRDAPVEATSMQHHDHRLEMQIEGNLKGTTTDQQARKLLNDIVRCVGTDPTWGRLARWTELTSHEIDLSQGEVMYGAVRVTITVVYRTTQWTT